MYLEDWERERLLGTTAAAQAAAWGIARATHWRWTRRQEPAKARPSRLAAKRVEQIVALDARYRSSWDARAIAHVTGVGKTSVAKILRERRGPRPKPPKPTHARRTRFQARDVMWSSDFVVTPDGRKLLKTIDEFSRLRIAWDFTGAESAGDVVRHARRALERMGRGPLVWKFDHGSGFMSHAFGALLAEHGIASYPIPPRAPWANGRTERDHQEIKNWLIPSTALSGAALERDVDEGMLMLNYLKPRAVLGFKTSARVYFGDQGVDEACRGEFRMRLKQKLGGSKVERLQRRAIRTILSELGLYEEWLQTDGQAGSVNRTSDQNVRN